MAWPTGQVAMDSCERVAAAVAHQMPDRVPLDYWAVQENSDRIMAAYGLPVIAALRRFLGVDMVHVAPRMRRSLMERPGTDDRFDAWGSRRAWVVNADGSGAWAFAASPLVDIDTVEGLRGFQWPNLDMFEWEEFSRQLDAHEGLAITGGFLTIFAACWLLRGIENALLDLALRPEFAHHLIDRITDFEYAFVEKTLEVADGRMHYFGTFDDWGTQTGLMMSPTMFREFYKEPVRYAFQLAQSKGVGIFCHTDGSVAELMDDLVDLGIAILNPVQMTCAGMDPVRLKRNYGAKVCFHSAIDTQRVLPYGTVEDVKRETLMRMAQFGQDGGYIAAPCHELQNDVPMENIMALYETVREHGWYPFDFQDELDRLAAPADG